MNVKACFVHVGKKQAGGQLIKLLPLGLPALADLLDREGCPSTIVHLPLERSLSSTFDLPRFISAGAFPVALFDLHWHYQSHDVVEAVRDLARRQDRPKIVLGGFTASFFHDEIMRTVSEVDFIIRGDSEIPLTRLMRALSDKETDFSGAPNLSWRKAEKIIHNPAGYRVTREILDRLNFTRFELILHHRQYLERLSTGPGRFDREPIFYYTPGRGCSSDCAFCGGARAAQKLINNRSSIALSSVDAVMRQFRDLKRHNIRKVCICFDPSPKSRYYLEIFERIRAEGLDIAMDFECFSLPTPEFIDDFSRTFKSDSSITLSPETGSDRVRKLNKGMYYSNSDLIKALERLSARGTKVYLAFAAGLAHETRKDSAATIELIRLVRKRFGNVEFHIGVVELEPASSWSLHGKRHGIAGDRSTFLDFYRIHEKQSSLGYSTEHLTERQIMALRRIYQAEAGCKISQTISGP